MKIGKEFDNFILKQMINFREKFSSETDYKNSVCVLL